MENNHDNNDLTEVQILKDGLDFLFERVQFINQTLAGLPSDVSSQRVLDLELDQQLTSISDRIYNTSSSILELASGKGSEQLKPSFEDLMEGQFTNLTDVTDSLFERVDIGLDHIRAQTNSSEKAGFSLQKQNFVTTFQPNEQSKKAPLKFLAAKNLNRPQVFFTDKIDNSASTHFVSWVYRNMSKPHAIAPLDNILLPLFNKPSEEITLKELESKSLPHPYEYEIRNYQPSESILSKEDTQVALSMDEVPLYFVETVEQLEEILPKLLNVKELAIDLEHHDYLTYQGFTCLMQISTRTEDFIIDTLKLRKELFILNQAFANPQIVKVLHGADFDVIWLQRDFGLYLVGLFDTYQASKLLNTEQKSLAYLLKNKTEAKFEADKKYQLADWRIRPLTKEMINYARADTHYLLEIYDNLKSELSENTHPNHPNQLYTVLDWSQEIALKKHEKSVIDFEFGLGPNGWAKILKKFNVPLTPRQVEAFKYLHRWRDMIARQQDDSVRYVLPDHLLIKFATNLPTSTSDVFKLCDVVPNIVRSDATEIVNIINEAKQASLTVSEQVANTTKVTVSSVTTGVENISIDSEKPHRPLVDVLPPNLVVTDLTKQHSQLFGRNYKFTDNFHVATRNAQVDQILSNLRFSPLPDNIKIIFDEVVNPDDGVIYKKPKREIEETTIQLEQKVYQLSTSIEATKPNEALISEPQLHLGSENIVNPNDNIPSSGYDYEAELNKMTKDLAIPAAKKSKFVNKTKNSFNPQNEIIDTITQPKKKANHNEKGNRSIYVNKEKGKK